MSDDERVRWARALGVAGWLFLLAYLGIVIAQVRRAAAISTPSFEDGLWWQRVEQISFAARPQNLVVLVPAAAAAVVGTLAVRTVVDAAVVWIGHLVRIVAGTCYVAIAIAALGVIGVFFRNPDNVGDVQAVLGGVGGMLMAVAMVKLCLEAERVATTG